MQQKLLTGALLHDPGSLFWMNPWWDSIPVCPPFKELMDHMTRGARSSFHSRVGNAERLATGWASLQRTPHCLRDAQELRNRKAQGNTLERLFLELTRRRKKPVVGCGAVQNTLNVRTTGPRLNTSILEAPANLNRCDLRPGTYSGDGRNGDCMVLDRLHLRDDVRSPTYAAGSCCWRPGHDLVLRRVLYLCLLLQ